MKYKFLRISLLSALTALFGGTALGATETVTYALQEGDAHVAGETVNVVADNEEVVATLTFGVEGDKDFTAPKKDDKRITGFWGYTEGNGVNPTVTDGVATAGTVYTIKPKYDGNVEVGVVLNADKKFYVLEDGTALADYDGITVNPKYQGTYKFDVVGGKEYLVYCAGSKLGFYGFNYTYELGTGEGEEPGGNDGGDTDSAWTLETTLDFTTATYPEDPTIVLETSKCGTAYDTGNKKQQDIFKAIEPAELGGRLAFQAVSNGNGKGWWIRASKGGLWSYNAGRSAAVLDLTTGDRVVFHCTQSASTVMSLVNGNNEPDGPFVYEPGEDGKSYICTMVGDGNIGFFGNQSQGYISSIEIYKPNGEVVLADYTVKYVSEEGNELKEPSVYQGIAGTVPTVSEADKARITVDDVTYIYASDDAADQIINKDGSTVVTIVFKKPEPVSYKVNEVAGGQIVRTTEGKDIEGTSIKVPYRSHNVLDGKLYKRGVTNKEYNHTFTLTTDGQVVNLDYTATDVNNVVYLAEGEDIEGLTLCTGADAANSAIRSSNSAAAYAAEDVEIVTLGAGVYTLHAVIFDASKTPDSHWVFKAGEEEIADLHCTAINYEELASKEFTLTEETAIVMAKAGSNKMGLDLIYITGDGDVVTGISSVNAKAENGEVYNLQGQKVEKAQKGLYIVNGKKVVVK